MPLEADPYKGQPPHSARLFADHRDSLTGFN